MRVTTFLNEGTTTPNLVEREIGTTEQVVRITPD